MGAAALGQAIILFSSGQSTAVSPVGPSLRPVQTTSAQAAVAPVAGIIAPMRIAVAINPQASFGKRSTAGAAAVHQFRSAGHDVLELRADSAGRLEEAVRTALTAGIDALVVVGGDGLVHLAVNVLAGPEWDRVPLGIVPSGRQ